MTVRHFLNGRVTLHAGDCLAVLPTLAENSVESCVTDPPYHLASIVKRFGSPTAAPVKLKRLNGQGGSPFARGAKGFMGKRWDGGDIAFDPETWAAVLRVLKPGGHLLAFAAPRNQHRMICAIEDAGFEIRDCLQWIFGSGFPKSHDVSKGIDRMLGSEREVVGPRVYVDGTVGSWRATSSDKYAQDAWTQDNSDRPKLITAPATDAARQWEGYGTSLKPAHEPICLARKPLSEKTVAANVLRWGTGALNISACRVGLAENDPLQNGLSGDYEHLDTAERGWGFKHVDRPAGLGRWPANIIHDGSDEVVSAFPESNIGGGPKSANQTPGSVWGIGAERSSVPGGAIYGDSGSAARFFYSSKADQDDRLGSRHPTVKPLDLMQYLVRLVTPRGGTALDPFAGTGTTGEVAWREGCNAILIEREPEYVTDIERRMALALAGPDERARESIKARLRDKPQDHGPLLDWLAEKNAAKEQELPHEA